eukprot:1605639-Prorocentrum_lima.AAC.1
MRQWLQQALLRGAGKAHRWTTAVMRPPSPAEEILVNGEILFDPQQAVQARALEWENIWKPRAGTKPAPPWRT